MPFKRLACKKKIPQSEIGETSNPHPASRDTIPRRRILTEDQRALLLDTFSQEAIDFMLDNKTAKVGDFLDEALGILPGAPEPTSSKQPPTRPQDNSLVKYCRLCNKVGPKEIMVNCGKCYYWYHESCLPTPNPPSDPWKCPIDGSEIRIFMSYGIRDGELVMSGSAINQSCSITRNGHD